MSQVRPYTIGVTVEGTPMAALSARITADLAGNRIQAACPHTADHLSLPGWIYGCGDCVRALTAARDACQPPQCSCCATAPATLTNCRLAGAVTSFQPESAGQRPGVAGFGGAHAGGSG